MKLDQLSDEDRQFLAMWCSLPPDYQQAMRELMERWGEGRGPSG